MTHEEQCCSGAVEPRCKKQLSSASLAEAGKGTSGLEHMQNHPPHGSGTRRKTPILRFLLSCPPRGCEQLKQEKKT